MSALTASGTPNTSATRVSMLDVERWDEFDDLYRPLVVKYLRVLRDKHRVDLSGEDIDELQQRIMVRVYQKLPDFEHGGRVGSFRKWLFIVSQRCLWDYLRGRAARGGSRAQALLEELEESAGAMSEVWDREYHSHILERLFEQIVHDFEPLTWTAFLLVTLKGQSTTEAAQKLGVTPNAVRIAKSRVMRRLRKIGGELLDSDMELPGRAQR